ncbi:MAG: DNA polymerase III subunit delta [Pelagibacterales bacterium MED-G44]|nr:MAG: DNA polymerase III subunit delta [Pelagibacterales bacterium MED-G44]
MILKTHDLNKNVDAKIFLFHGVNEGQKEEILEKKFKPIFGDNVFKYYEREIFSDIENFYNQVLSKSFFEKNKLIIIKDASDKIRDEIEILKSKKLDEIKIVLICSVLDKKSKLRNLFEKEKDLISIAFYSDNNQALATIAKSFFLAKNVSISQESIDLLVNRANGERKNLNNELTKIESYLTNKKKISVEEIHTLTNLSENYSINQLVDNCLAKNKSRAIYILNENNFSFEEAIIIIRTFLIKAKRLIKLNQNLQENKNIDKTIVSFKPPIFWKDKELVKNQIKIWTLDNTYKLMEEINKVELNIKKNSTNALDILFDFILNTSKTNN